MMQVFDIQHFSVQDGPGIRVSVFLKGCPLNCGWCHNPESKSRKPVLLYYADKCAGCGACASVCPNGVHRLEAVKGHILLRDRCTVCGKCTSVCPEKALETAGRNMKTEEILKEIVRDRPFLEGGGVTLSGGEPLIQPEEAAQLLRLCKGEGISTAIETAGCVPFAAFEKVLPFTDLILYDVKAVSLKLHRKGTGTDNRLILENLDRCLKEFTGCIWVRIPVIPGFNADAGEMEEIGRYLAPRSARIERVELLPYHDVGESKYHALSIPYPFADTPVPGPDEMKSYRDILRKCGVLL